MPGGIPGQIGGAVFPGRPPGSVDEIAARIRAQAEQIRARLERLSPEQLWITIWETVEELRVACEIFVRKCIEQYRGHEGEPGEPAPARES